MAAIELVGNAGRAESARQRKSLHPSCYLLIGLVTMIAAALLLDMLVGAIVLG